MRARQEFTLTISPNDALQCDVIQIDVEGCAPGERITVSAELKDEAGVTWRSSGEFTADHRGSVALDKAPSEGGSYQGVISNGLFWSMLPDGPHQGRDFLMNANERLHMFGLPSCDPTSPVKVSFVARSQRGSSAEHAVVLRKLSAGVEKADVRTGRLRGLSLRWADRTRSKGAILSFGGSGGGLELYFAPLLASLGYDVLSLAYFAHEDLPPKLANIPLEYFGEAFAWMREAFGHRRIAVQGASRGGELSLLLASHFPDDVAGCIGIVPMHAVTHGWDHETNQSGPCWTWFGEPLPYVVPSAPISMDTVREIAANRPEGYAAAPAYLADLQRPESRGACAIPVERATGPILLISGAQDQVWPCSWGSDRVIDRLRVHGFKHYAEHLRLHETGHITPLPNVITTSVESSYHPLANALLACGGTPEGTARAAWRMWKAMKRHYEMVFPVS